jgi:hypothetical protein
MHRCFETYDLVVALLDALSELFDESEEGETNRKRALARMALTCKVFLHPALNLLWQRLTGLEPIVQFFPTQSQGDGIVRDSSNSAIWKLNRPAIIEALYPPRRLDAYILLHRKNTESGYQRITSCF